MNGLSPLAHPIAQLRSGSPRSQPVWGVAVHTTGESIVDQARTHNADPLEYAASYYEQPDAYYPHYVVGYDGSILQVADETVRALHIGMKAADHDAFLDGSWTGQLPADLVARWQTQWPEHKHPAGLFSGPSPNEVYIGVEMLPLVVGVEQAPASWLKGARFTEAQHQAMAALAVDIAARWEFPPSWWTTGRLVGHEDVNPIERHTQNPAAGWDPGWLRPEPWFDFGWLRGRIASLSPSGGEATPDDPGLADQTG